MNNDISVEAIHYETGRPVRIEITDGLIRNLIDISGDEATDNNWYVAPGLIDNQINGYSGIDFSKQDLTIGEMKKAVEAIRTDGVTSFFPAVITNSHSSLLRIFKNLSATLKDEQIRNSVAGFHLEGPYISSEKGFYGCHPVSYIRKPSWTEFIEYQDAADGNIRQVTVSPEVEGALDFIRLCTQNNVLVSIGHSNATAEQINQAADNGARLSTHLGNGCANMIDRHLNPIWPQLANDLLTPSIIADGHHLTHEEIKVFYKVKGLDNLILTSDVTHFFGMPPGKYMYFGSEIIYSGDGLIKNPELNCLAGASFPIKKGVETMMSSAGCSIAEAINFATKNVSIACKLPDRGSLVRDKRADFILFEKKDDKLHIRQTWVNGVRIYSR